MYLCHNKMQSSAVYGVTATHTNAEEDSISQFTEGGGKEQLMGDYITNPPNASTLIGPSSCLESRCIRTLPFVAMEALTQSISHTFCSTDYWAVGSIADPTINDDLGSLKPIPPCSCP